MPGKRLFLIDGYSNIFRAYFAIPNLSNSKGIPTNAVYGFHNMLRKLLREEQPDLIGVAWDVSSRTVRSEKFEAYKANRTPMPDDLRSQIKRIRQVLEGYRIPILELPNWEADDVIGTLALQACAQGYDVTIVSADKDLLQLVRPGISVAHTFREKVYTPELVEADIGVPPDRVVDLLALIGDSIDNIPGVPGIGEKGAPQLIREFGSLEALLDRSAEVKRKNYREGLEQHREQALLSKELATIRTDLPLTFDPALLERQPQDTETLRTIFAELEFFSLLAELTTVTAVSELKQAEEVTSAAELPALLGALPQRVSLLALGPEAPIGVAIPDAAGGARWVDFRRDGLRGAFVETLASWLAEPGRRLLGHDVKEVLRLVPTVRACCGLDDVMLWSYLLNPALKGSSLEEIALEALHHRAMTYLDAGWAKGRARPALTDAQGELGEGVEWAAASPRGARGEPQEPAPGDPRLLALAGERVELLGRLDERLSAQLADSPLAKVYTDIEAPLVGVLMAMEEAGVALDVPFLQKMGVELGDELAKLEKEAWQIAGEEFNLGSPRQLGEVLFEKLQYPIFKRTRKTKSYSTDVETLQDLAAKGFPLADVVMRHRELSKLKGTYVDAFPVLVDSAGRLHTRYEQAVAATGRISSKDPNLQNIPVRTTVGQQIRRAFVAPPGRALLVADYSQIELRLLAHIAGEEAMLEAFRTGRDIHTATAASVFGISPELVSPDQRRAAKTINFGIIYGMSAFGLAKNLKISSKEAEAFITAYRARYPGVVRYTEETVSSALVTGKVETLYGRARFLPELQSRNYAVRENARRMAINARIQGTAADILKLAMVAVHRALADEHLDARLLLTVHDELVLEVPDSQAEAVAAVVKREMEGVAQLSVPLAVDTGWGRNWYEAKA
ncbi:MAG TPA: DNA polymerase I [Thermoanaerobaculia bacterium]|jgi:DNA polymerase-1|nr:DNA polymerase I [Thermoanaerobaculia bacterium]